MDFAETLRQIGAFLDKRELRYALVGGLALAAFGGTRTTLDLDLAVDGDGQDDVISFMESQGFETLHRSSGYSNHVHSDADRGRVDFIYLRGDTRDELFGSARPHEFSPGIEVLVPKAAHLAAMKVVAMKNDPSRTLQELADIRVLVKNDEMAREEVRAFFRKHGLEGRWHELEETL